MDKTKGYISLAKIMTSKKVALREEKLAKRIRSLLVHSISGG
jgi:hypothetical protein